MMKNNIINLITELSERPELQKMRFRLTINLVNLISEYKSKELFGDSLDKIINIVSQETKINSFNFTLYDNEDGKFDYEDSFDRYNSYWFESNLVFYGVGDVINSNFYFLSKGLSLNNLNEENSTIDELININEFYKETSEKIFKLLK